MKTYKEFIHGICTSANLDDEDSVIFAMQQLAYEAIHYRDAYKACEKKMGEVMSYKDYKEWEAKAAKELFQKELEGMVESEFKDFIMDNLDLIYGEDDEDETD